MYCLKMKPRLRVRVTSKVAFLDALPLGARLFIPKDEAKCWKAALSDAAVCSFSRRKLSNGGIEIVRHEQNLVPLVDEWHPIEWAPPEPGDQF